jgi:sporulation and spore germination protein
MAGRPIAVNDIPTCLSLSLAAVLFLTCPGPWHKSNFSTDHGRIPFQRRMAMRNRKRSINMHCSWACVLRCAGWLAIAGLFVHFAGLQTVCIAGKGNAQLVHLYFSDAKRPFLVAEDRVVVYPGDPMAFGRQLVLELINGSTRGHVATLPAGTKLRSFFLLDDGTAVVDFSAQLRENHPGSCRREQLTLFSVVNSLVLNVPEIDHLNSL